jgi:hypothetical protein
MFNIRHGSLEDVIGRPTTHSEITFVPARVKLHGTMFQSVFPLKDSLADVPPATIAAIRPGEDAPWVLGRLIHLFGTELVSDENRGDKSCFYAEFLAVYLADENLAIPFSCDDYYGKTAITFSSDDPPPENTQQQIVSAFWGLLLSAPTDIADHNGRMFHSGGGDWIDFGVSHGEPFMDVADD